MKQPLTIITRILNQPLLSWGALPLSMPLFGTILGAKQTGFRFFPVLLLYIFLLLTSLMERILLKKSQKAFTYHPKLNHLFWAAIAVILLVIGLAINWLSIGLLLLYLLFIFIAYQPNLKMDQTIYYLILQLFFKVVIINYLAYYAQTGFLEGRFMLYLLPIVAIFPALIIYRQMKVFKDKDSRYQYFIELYYLPVILITCLVGVLAIFVLLIIQKAGLGQLLIFAVPLLIIFILLALKNFRINMRMDNYINLVIMLAVLLYAFTVKYPG